MFQRISLATALLFVSGMTFAAGTFDANDANKDGMLSDDEYYGYLSDVDLYAEQDTDRDGLLSEDEFGVNGFDVDFETWDGDGDGYLSDSEFYEGTFNYFDEDENGHWDGNEWDDAGDAGWLDV